MFYVTKVKYEKNKKFCGVAIINEHPLKKISHANGIFYDLETKKYIPLKNSYMIKDSILENILDVINYFNKQKYNVSKYIFNKFISEINKLEIK